MKLLLDTHILLWTLSNHERLSEKARKLIENPDNEIYYSVASIWEIEMKYLAHPDQMNFRADGRVLQSIWFLSSPPQRGTYFLPEKLEAPRSCTSA